MYVCWTPDGTPDLIGHLTLVLTDSTRLIINCDRHLIGCLTGHILYCVISTLLFIYLFMSFLIPVYIMIICSHLYACAFSPFFSYTFTRSSDSLNLYIQIRDYLFLIRYLERITCTLRSWSLSPFLIIGIPTLLFMLFLDFLYIVSK